MNSETSRNSLNDSLENAPPEVIKQQVDEELAARSLRDFLPHFWPLLESTEFESNWHIDAICDHVEAAFNRDIRRLIITMPPRHTKSRVKIFSVAYRWLHAPGERFLSAVYDGDLSRNDNVDARSIIRDESYQRMVRTRYPDFQFQYDRNVKGRFDNNKGGYSIATSVGSALFGMGGSIRWIDDPHNYTDLDSETEKEQKINWFERGMTTRIIDPRTYVTVVICQRTAVNDLVGHILSKYGGGWGTGEWVHLKLPFRYTGSNQIISPLDWEDPRTKEGEILWKERFPEEEAQEWELHLTEDDQAAQLQQSPQLSGNAIVNPNKLQRVDYLHRQDVVQAVRFWDKAATSGGGNATAGVLMLRYGDGSFVVADVTRGHWGMDEREENIKRVAQSDLAMWGDKLETSMEMEPGSSGKVDANHTIRNLAGYNVTAEFSTGSKDVRLKPFATQVRAENVYVLDGQDWTESFFGDMGRTYPEKTKDRDVADAAAGAFNRMTSVELVGAA